MTDKFEVLKAAALAATPGPWEYREESFDYSIRQAGSTIKYSGCEEYIPIAGEVTGGGTAAFIAAASPDVVLSLLAALEEEQKRNSAYANLVNSKNKTIAEYSKVIDDQAILIKSMTSDEIEGQRNANAQLTDELQSVEQRNAELEQRLQQPIRLPHPAKANRIKQKGIGESDETYVRGVNDGLHYSAEAIRAAGFKVEGE